MFLVPWSMMHLMCVPFAGTYQLDHWEHWMAWDAMALAFLPLYYVSAHLSIIIVSFSIISSLTLQCLTLSLSFPPLLLLFYPFSLLIRIPEEEVEEVAWLTTDAAAP